MAALTPPYNGGGSLSLATMAVLTGGYNGGGSARVAQVSSILFVLTMAMIAWAAWDSGYKLCSATPYHTPLPTYTTPLSA